MVRRGWWAKLLVVDEVLKRHLLILMGSDALGVP
jgi:hypothetical protein